MSNISAFAHGFVNGVTVIPSFMYNYSDYPEYDPYIYELGVNIGGWTLIGLGSYFVLDGMLSTVETNTYHSSGVIDSIIISADVNKVILGDCLVAAGAYNVIFNNPFSNDYSSLELIGETASGI